MMGVLVVLLTTIEVLAALLLIGIVLIQQSKAGGGLTAMGGGMTETVFGAAAGNVLTRGTVILAAVFLSVSLLLAVITGRHGPRRSVAESLTDKPAVEASAETGAPGPAAELDERAGEDSSGDASSDATE